MARPSSRTGRCGCAAATSTLKRRAPRSRWVRGGCRSRRRASGCVFGEASACRSGSRSGIRRRSSGSSKRPAPTSRDGIRPSSTPRRSAPAARCTRSSSSSSRCGAGGDPLLHAPAHRVRRHVRQWYSKARAPGCRRCVLGDDGDPARVVRELPARRRRGRRVDGGRLARGLGAGRAPARRGRVRARVLRRRAGAARAPLSRLKTRRRAVPLRNGAPRAGAVSAPRHGVAGLNVESAQPILSWPFWFQIGFLPPTICASPYCGAPEPEPEPPMNPMKIVEPL